MNKQRGFSIAELGIVCLVVLMVGALGYVFYNKWIDGAAQTEVAQTSTSETAAPTVATTEDLSKAEAALDAADLSDDSSLSTLDADLSNF